MLRKVAWDLPKMINGVRAQLEQRRGELLDLEVRMLHEIPGRCLVAELVNGRHPVVARGGGEVCEIGNPAPAIS